MSPRARKPPSRLPLRLSERRALLVVGDLLAISALLVLLWLWALWGFGALSRPYLLSVTECFLLSALWLTAASVNGLYDLKVAANLVTSGRGLVLSAALVLVAYMMISLFSPFLFVHPAMILFRSAAALVLVGLWRATYAVVFSQARFRRRILVIGGGWAGATIAQAILAHADSAYEIVGFIDDDPAKQGQRILGLPVLGIGQDLSRLAQTHRVTELILAISHRVGPELLEALIECQEQGVQLTSMPVLYEALLGQVPVDHVGQNWHLALPVDHPQNRIGYALLKRLVDLAVAVAGLTLFVVLLPFLALAIRLDSRGSIFYRQSRVGKGGTVFQLVKLRTMVEDAESDGRAVWAQARDPRTTRVGNFLRVTMLDEVPQLWNVLKGEMSFVGPRPERPELITELEQKIPFFRLRNAVRPGMAGWALINQGYGRSVEDSQIKLQYDLYYIKHQWLWFDLVIVLRTIGRALSFRRAEVTNNQEAPQK